MLYVLFPWQKDDCRELKISQERFLADGDSDGEYTFENVKNLLT